MASVGLTTFSGIGGLLVCVCVIWEWNLEAGIHREREEIGTKNKKSMIDDRGRKLKCRNIYGIKSQTVSENRIWA